MQAGRIWADHQHLERGKDFEHFHLHWGNEGRRITPMRFYASRLDRSILEDFKVAIWDRHVGISF